MNSPPTLALENDKRNSGGKKGTPMKKKDIKRVMELELNALLDTCSMKIKQHTRNVINDETWRVLSVKKYNITTLNIKDKSIPKETIVQEIYEFFLIVINEYIFNNSDDLMTRACALQCMENESFKTKLDNVAKLRSQLNGNASKDTSPEKELFTLYNNNADKEKSKKKEADVIAIDPTEFAKNISLGLKSPPFSPLFRNFNDNILNSPPRLDTTTDMNSISQASEDELLIVVQKLGKRARTEIDADKELVEFISKFKDTILFTEGRLEFYKTLLSKLVGSLDVVEEAQKKLKIDHKKKSLERITNLWED